MAEVEKSVLGSVRLDSDVWEAVRAMPASLNQYLRESLLNDVRAVGARGVNTKGSHRKLSKKAQLAEQRKAADPLAHERTDIDYMNPDELPSAGSVGIASVVENAGSVQHLGTKSLPDWRAGRKPLLKPSERNKK